MAIADKKEEEILTKVKALVYLKYDTENHKPGEEFDVREEDKKELVEKGYVEAMEVPREGE
ncbi:hypothetical protein [Clostridium gasigenes]|uniref:DUF7210 domain-containing protein n=1 Tax=Clostridium gasigenes TaxID=94869 RepID=A0A1H0N5X6_9CLOT|nr:hypothetical protein [Clostridium gasigenes]SDO88038.1 hypothetical protein SAMN04488529_101701 [Clostridium gasigenes]